MEAGPVHPTTCGYSGNHKWNVESKGREERLLSLCCCFDCDFVLRRVVFGRLNQLQRHLGEEADPLYAGQISPAAPFVDVHDYENLIVSFNAHTIAHPGDLHLI
jgi:hypothetical protein